MADFIKLDTNYPGALEGQTCIPSLRRLYPPGPKSRADDWCEPAWDRYCCGPPDWRVFAVRAAAVYPCIAQRFISIAAYAQARVVYAPDYNSACTLHLEHLHPARVLASTDVCHWKAPKYECGVRKAVARFPYACA